MKRLYFSKLMILLAVLSAWSLTATAQCNCNWGYKMPVAIANLGASALTNYQVSVTVNTQALVLAGKMIATGDDIRFVDATCTNLPYWIQTGTMNTASTVIWIKVNSIPVAGATINMFYGNPSAASASDGNATFILFDDFNGSSLDPTKWIYTGPDAMTISGGTVSINGGSWGEIESISAFTGPVWAEVKVNSVTGAWPSLAQADDANFNFGSCMFMNGGTMYFGNTCGSNCGIPAPGYEAYLNNNTSAGATSGIWGFARTSSSGSFAVWPGGTYNYTGSQSSSSANQRLAFGPLDGGTATLVVDWFRARQYYAAGTTQTPGAEISNLVLPITGSSTVCTGTTTTLSDAAPGGSWSSSNPAQASIGSASGIVTGIAVGTPTITYTAPSGCFTTFSITVNPSPAAITGAAAFCQFTTLTLNDVTPGGTWSSSNGNVTIGSGTGIASGVSAGTSVISYTLPAGCFSTASVTVNAAPLPITGTASVCASGGTTTLSDGVAGGSWTSSTTTVATIGAGTGIVTGAAPGISTITYTLPTGCITTIPVTVNPLPGPIGGPTNVCVGSTTTLTDGTPGGTWTSSNTALATVGLGTGIVTGVLAGIPTITYTLSGTGCRITAPVLVNPLPTPISGSSNVCVGATTTLSDGGGGSWTSGTTGVATIGPLTGLVSGIAPGSSVITYTLPTGCNTSTTILVNPLPLAYTMTGGGSFCATGTGSHVGLSFGSSGISYQLYNGVTATGFPVLGSNAGLDFGAQTSAGTYTAVATNTITGCTNTMTGSVTVTILPLPNVYNVTVTNGGGYCAGGTGVHLGVDNSTTGVNYRLYYGPTPVGPLLSGTTGLALDFGLYTATGAYSVLATNSVTGCSTLMSGNPTVYINPLPTVYTVSGGGNYCALGTGVHIFLSGSDGTANYTVYRSPGIIAGGAAGTTAPLDFGPFTTVGTYTVVATDATGTGCTSNMTGSATVGINPLPTRYAVTGGGGYCAGSACPHVGLGFSNTGINYTLILNGTTPMGTVAGSGSGLDFGAQCTTGTYTVVGVNAATSCANNMTDSVVVNINALPFPFNVTGTGNYCLGGTGLPIGIDGSQLNVNYKLYRGTTLVGTFPGTNFPVTFGTYTAPGIYTVVATNSITGCTNNLNGNATIVVNPLPTVHTVTGGGSYCAGGTGVDVALNGSNTGIFYDLYNGTFTGTTVSGTGGIIHFGLQPGGIYTVVARDSVTGCTKNMSGSVTVTANPLPTLFNMTGGGTDCAGGTGFHIGLDSSSTLINYQLLNGSTLVGSPLAGTGFPLDFGIKTTAGVYTVNATNSLTGCNVAMNGFSTIIVNPLPLAYTVGGGGNYCALGGSGTHITLSFSDTGFRYQLYRGTTPVGLPMNGIAGSLDFGPQTAGVYTVVGQDTTTLCTKNMAGSATSVAFSPVVYTVTGGGHFCSGGIGRHVGLSGSALGTSYQLYKGTPLGLSKAGTGSSLDFGLEIAAGVYTVVATDTTLGCTANMVSSATVVVDPLPVVANVTGGGAFCAGGTGKHVGLDTSYTGINYQLYNGILTVGTAVSGSGTPLDFGIKTTAGTYTVVATDATTGCTSNMAGSAAINVVPVPHAYTTEVGGYYGNYCATDSGVHVYLNNSDTGVYYQLYRGTTAIGGLVAGTDTMLDLGLQTVAGTYTITGRDTGTACSNIMLSSATVNIVPLPDVHSVTGGGSFCAGASGVHVGLDGSDLGIRYQLHNGLSLISTLYGTGVALDFGLQDSTGTYTVMGTSAITPCDNNMFGSAVVAHDTLLTPVIAIQAYPGTGIGVWHIDSVRVFVSNGGNDPTYQWYVNEHLIPGATSQSFTRYELFNKDSVSCQVTASGPCGGYTASKSIIITLHTVGVNQVTSLSNDIRLIPNPNKGAFTLKGSLGITADEEVSIEVTNMLGQVVYTNKIMTQGGNIDEHIQINNTLANGMYLLNLRSQSANTVFHFVVEQ